MDCKIDNSWNPVSDTGFHNDTPVLSFGLCYTISILAWEPSPAQFNKSYLRRLPALTRFLPGKYIFAVKVDSLNKEHSRGFPEFPNQNLRQISPRVPELWSDKQTNKQWLQFYTYILYIYIRNKHFTSLAWEDKYVG